MKRTQKLVLLALAYAMFFSPAPISCADTDTDGEPARKSSTIVPKCATIQEPNDELFDMLETIEEEIYDSLRILRSHERWIQYAQPRRASVASVTNRVDAYRPLDFAAYLKGRREVLDELLEMRGRARFEAMKWADFEVPLPKAQHNSRSTNDTCRQNSETNRP